MCNWGFQLVGSRRSPIPSIYGWSFGQCRLKVADLMELHTVRAAYELADVMIRQQRTG